MKRQMLKKEVVEKILSEQDKVKKKKDRGETLTCEDKLAYAFTTEGNYKQSAVQRCEEEKTVQAKSETLTCLDKLEEDENGNVNQEEYIDCYAEIQAKQGMVKVYSGYVTKRGL